MKKKCIACHKEVEMPVISPWLNAETMRTCPVCVGLALDALYLVCQVSTARPVFIPLTEVQVLKRQVQYLRRRLKGKGKRVCSEQALKNIRAGATKRWAKHRAKQAS